MWFGFGLGRLDRFWFGSNTTTLSPMALCSPGRTVSCPSVFRDQSYDWVENEPPSLPSPAPAAVPSDPGPHPGRARESEESSGSQTPHPASQGLRLITSAVVLMPPWVVGRMQKAAFTTLLAVNVTPCVFSLAPKTPTQHERKNLSALFSNQKAWAVSRLIISSAFLDPGKIS